MARCYRVGSLFTGIGGIDLAFERVSGFTVTWQIEKAPFARRILAKHWHGIPLHDDVCTSGAHTLGPAHILIGGFPCQDASNAGTRTGLAGARSGLWRDYARILRDLTPLAAVVENVESLRSRGLGDVLADLDAAGYAAEWHCLPATVVGAPHERDRIYLIAMPRSWVRGTANAPQPAAQALLAAWLERYRTGITPWIEDPHPHVARTARDVPLRDNRLIVLGNSVVPHIFECIARTLKTLLADDAPAAPSVAVTHIATRQDAALWQPQLGYEPRKDRKQSTEDVEWPRSALMLDGRVFALPTLAPQTFGNNVLLWPSPKAGDGMGGGTTSKGKDYPTGLRAAVRGLNPKYLPKLGSGFTPPGRGDALNPDWVEWLMGFPRGWTRVDEPPHGRTSRAPRPAPAPGIEQLSMFDLQPASVAAL